MTWNSLTNKTKPGESRGRFCTIAPVIPVVKSSRAIPAVTPHPEQSLLETRGRFRVVVAAPEPGRA